MDRPKIDLPPIPYIDAYKPGIDLTLLRENLKLSPEQRILKMESFMEFCAELKRARRISKPSVTEPLVDRPDEE